MMDTSMHSEPSELERAVYVEACHDGVNPATMVRIVYKGEMPPSPRNAHSSTRSRKR